MRKLQLILEHTPISLALPAELRSISAPTATSSVVS
jgi:hypothetical protein